MNDIRNYYLQNLGIGEVWMLRHADALVDAELSVTESAQSAFEASTVVRQVLPVNERQSTWRDIQAEILRCEKCPQCQLLGKSQDQSHSEIEAIDVVVVTEYAAPEQISESEKLLRNALAALSLGEGGRNARSYRCSLFKAREPHFSVFDSNFKQDHADTCLPFLLQEIRAIQPRAIVLFGERVATTLLNLLEQPKISDLRKIQHSYLDIPVIVTYSCEEMLSDPNCKYDVWTDFCRLKALL